MMDQLHQSHPEIIKRLRRAEGHLHKVIGMVEDGRSCLDLAQAITRSRKRNSRSEKDIDP